MNSRTTADRGDAVPVSRATGGDITYVSDARFAPMAQALIENETKIIGELTSVQGKPVDLGGYYLPDPGMCTAVMRPSPTFNAALQAAAAGPQGGSTGSHPAPKREDVSAM